MNPQKTSPRLLFWSCSITAAHSKTRSVIQSALQAGSAVYEKRLKHTCGAPSAVRRTSRPLFIIIWLRWPAPHAATEALACDNELNNTAWADAHGLAPPPLARRRGTNLPVL